MEKFLIIRFSSIGDIIQCMSVIDEIKIKYPNSEIHWIARKDMAPLLNIDTRIDKIWEFDRTKGVKGLIKTTLHLKSLNFTHIYDAHSNIRSNIIKLILCPFSLCNLIGKKQLVTRHKKRLKRLLLFKFRINLFPKPFRSFESFTMPLNRFKQTGKTKLIQNNYTHIYHFPTEITEKVNSYLMPVIDKRWICLVPSAAWELKRWPVDYWQKLVMLLPEYQFVIIGGSTDTFIEEIKQVAQDRVINLAGKTNLLESFYIIHQSPYVISGDTGFLHAADLFNKPGLAIIGPTAFGFPTGEKMKILEVNLPCRPCTKDGSVKCKNKINKQCLIDIKPEYVAKNVINQ
ncbi:MAG: glycosyltransferase family 9 protein [Marinilabiliaceae bacterium]|nr:glycosyltransferase family 9 protein [Marinilabiliaceae bacterium]